MERKLTTPITILRFVCETFNKPHMMGFPLKTLRENDLWSELLSKFSKWLNELELNNVWFETDWQVHVDFLSKNQCYLQYPLLVNPIKTMDFSQNRCSLLVTFRAQIMVSFLPFDSDSLSSTLLSSFHSLQNEKIYFRVINVILAFIIKT